MPQLATRTPPGGTPVSATQVRVKVLLKAALEDEHRGNLQSAETNLRLAQAYGGTPDIAGALQRVVDAREQARRKASGLR
ncbi:MAG: hypothetical protein SFW67_32140 [Myxococcaceae bacterium]|nr:hypothetical protein [Myxococcaceae bacterium]